MATGYPKRTSTIEVSGDDVSTGNPLPVSMSSSQIVRAELGSGDLAIDAWGSPKFTQPFSVFHGLWTFDVSSKLWIVKENNIEINSHSSTKATSYNGMLSVVSGMTANDSTLVSSKRHPRYQPNRGHLFSSAVFLPNTTNNGVRDFGLFTSENGVFFRLKSDGKLYAVLRTMGVEVKEELITVPFSIDISKGNTYDIQTQWRGVGNYKFFIGNPATGNQELVHVFNILGTQTEVSMANPALPVAFYAKNITQQVSILVGCVDITSEGGTNDKQYYSSAVNTNVTVTNDTPILAIRQPLTINGATNTRDFQLSRITINSSKKGVVSFWLTREQQSVIGGSWTSIPGSYVEQNKSATSVDTSKLQLVTQFNVEALVSKEITNPNKEVIQFWLVYGDYIVLTGSGSSAVIDAVIEFGEEI